jgi:putative membrane protein
MAKAKLSGARLVAVAVNLRAGLNLRSAPALLMPAWGLVMIATPIVLWTVGELAFPLMASLAVLAQFAASLTAARQPPCGLSLPALARLSLTAGGAAWLLEFIGQSTGWPFGRYYYTAALQPQVGGVPLLIPLAWLMMLLPAWAITQSILSGQRPRLGRAYPLAFAAVAGLVFTAWDLYLDPQMVSRGLWVWPDGGAYFGIPLQNYFGWWLGAAAITLIARPPSLPVAPLRLVYIVTWLLQAIALGIFWGQPWPALFGFTGMGVFIYLSLRAPALQP